MPRTTMVGFYDDIGRSSMRDLILLCGKNTPMVKFGLPYTPAASGVNGSALPGFTVGDLLDFQAERRARDEGHMGPDE